MTGPPANTFAPLSAGLQDWADFLYTFASRYHGRIRAYEIWNVSVHLGQRNQVFPAREITLALEKHLE